MQFSSTISRPLFAVGLAALLAAGALTLPGCGSPKAAPNSPAASVATAPKPAAVAPVAPVATTSVAKPAPTPPAAIAKISYNQHIQPILAENCFSCHGPDSASRKGKLRLDPLEFATASRAPGHP